jgi:hypothetical protein
MVYNTQKYWVLSKGPNRVGVFPHLRTETDPVSETLCFSLVFRKIRTMDKVQKPNISVCYTPSSEPYSIYKLYVFIGCTYVIVDLILFVFVLTC